MPTCWGAVPGGYRNTINDNIVLIEMIETLEGVKNAREIASDPRRHRDLCRQRRSGQFLRLRAGIARLRAPHQRRARCGARAPASGLCGPFAWRDRPDFTCFQTGSETAAIARGVATELGPLKDTQGKARSRAVRPAK